MRDIKEAASRILATYNGNPTRQVQAMQILFDTAVDREKTRLMEEAANEVCQHLHNTPSSGMACRDCANIEIELSRRDVAADPSLVLKIDPNSKEANFAEEVRKLMDGG